MENEKVLYFTRPSIRRMFFYAFLYTGAVVYGRMATELDPTFEPMWYGAMGVLAVILAFALLKRACTSYIITTQEVQVRRGILAREFIAIPVARITNTHASQSLLSRLLFIADLQIDCAGGDAQEITFQRITVADAKEAGRILKSRRERLQPEPEYRPAAEA